MSLAQLFPDGDYRFHLTLRRGEPGAFFGAQDRTGALLRERARWIESDPAQYVACRPEGIALAREIAAMAVAWGVSVHANGADPLEMVRGLGCQLEPDVLFLSADGEGRFRLHGGALCFPTGWALTEKVGHTLDFIHGVVPGLNATLGAPIHQFLTRLKPGVAFLRDNWGLAADPELNHHPSRQLAPPAPPIDLKKLWLRVEHQALVALPESRGILFGIRIALHRLDTLVAGPVRLAFRRALESMPAELAAYKRIDSIRPHLLNVL